MSEKPFSIRLSDEEKEVLERIAKSKGITMADVIRLWITKGDIVNVLAEQLADLSKDFAEWHLSNRSSSAVWIAETLMRDAPAEEVGIILRTFREEGNRLQNEFAQFRSKLNVFVKKKKIKEKEDLAIFITFLTSTLQRYENLARRLYDVAAIMPEENRDSVKEVYSNDFRVRYNELAVKCEDFLKRASRELGQSFERSLERVKEFPKRREPWRRE